MTSTDTAEIQIERRLASALLDLEDIAVLASRPETAQLLQKERVIIGQMARTLNITVGLLMVQPLSRVA